MIQPTTENYYSIDISREYMSCSQLHAFQECSEYAYHRYIVGDRKSEEIKAFTDGNFAHSYFEGKEAHDKFLESHPELYATRGKNTGELKAEYASAYQAFKKAEADKEWFYKMQGEHEVILTGEVCGQPWCIRVDVLNDEKKFASDFKYMASLNGSHWMKIPYDLEGNVMPINSNGLHVHHKNVEVPFWEKYSYWSRFAIYRTIIFQNTNEIYDMYMPVITKEHPSDRNVYCFDNAGRYQHEMAEIRNAMPSILKWRNGDDLQKCGKCGYCRNTKKIETIEIASSIW